MAYEQRELSGSIFKNEKKTTDNHPNMTGSALIDGKEYWVSAWTKDGAKGRWQSLAFTPKDKKASAGGGSAPQRGSHEPDDGDIPFAACDLSADTIFRKLHWSVE
jgi:hypothetical protein